MYKTQLTIDRSRYIEAWRERPCSLMIVIRDVEISNHFQLKSGLRNQIRGNAGQYQIPLDRLTSLIEMLPVKPFSISRIGVNDSFFIPIIRDDSSETAIIEAKRFDSRLEFKPLKSITNPRTR